MNSRFVTAVLAAAVLISPSLAQMRGAGVSRGIVGGAPGRGFRVDFGHGRVEHRFPRQPIFIGDPFWYSGYDSQPVYEAAAPEVIVVQPPAASAQTTPTVPPEPVVIEWQGDHFVRMTLAEASSRQRGPTDYSEKLNAKPGRKLQAQSPEELPPAVLVFRDGHKEEVSKYTIIGPNMYATSDYWSSGTWSKKIQLADLDVPSTVKLNQERGVKFKLPTSLNEVIIRP
jgi:hypothetical protein